MKTILSQSTDPYFNLAWEEYIFKHVACNEDILLLWQNDKSVIVGRNQVVFGEVNVTYCELHDIPIIRRISGGGTVYHDLGNLNFSVITSKYQDVISNYPYFTQKVVSYLNTLGVNVAFSGKSDIVIDKQKISGNAQMYHQKKVLHHGTILFDTDLKMLNQVIKKKSVEIMSNGIDSNRTDVTNIKYHLKNEMSLEAFKDGLLTYWLNQSDILADIIDLSQQDLDEIERLKSSKYLSWAWNYGESPNFEIIKIVNHQNVRIKVKSGLIQNLSLSTSNDEVTFDSIKGTRYEKNAFEAALNKLNKEEKAALTAFINLLFG